MADEMFVLLGWAWDIDTATLLAARHQSQRADIRPLAWARAVIRIDPDHAATVDLARSLLTVPFRGTGAPLLIDGWHRIHRALTTRKGRCVPLGRSP
ncbi:hypothetical protein ETD83_40395 [Actinomadura soli]|uniref:Uncharacterized protein n=1 Tax=Actinomadura soli TaxID=2508997 RepID=A0A5C4J1R9_9ACTN|nr:hypothetical protein [Actinomadura soli]TMQ86135.1 hypothetical protein ETD83_40395 [Actinomadura soli]